MRTRQQNRAKVLKVAYIAESSPNCLAVIDGQGTFWPRRYRRMAARNMARKALKNT